MTDAAHVGEPRQVVVLATTFPGSEGDGTPEFVLTLAAAMAQSLPTLVVAPRVPGAASRELIRGVAVRRFTYFPRRWERLAAEAIVPLLRSDPKVAVQVPFLLLAMAIDAFRVTRTPGTVVHAHWILPGGVIAAAIKLVRGTPFVLTVHGADAYTMNGPPVGWLKRWVLRSADSVVPVSRDIARRLGLAEESAAPMGVDMEALTSVGPGGTAPRGEDVLFIGRLADKKGVDDLLRALALTETSRLRIGGDGPERHALEQLTAELGLATRVSFLGHLDRAEVIAELRSAAAVAIPSRVAADGDQDGTPVVLMEAVALGAPVIATRLGGLGEYLVDGDNAFVVEPGDIEGLANRIGRVVAEPGVGDRLASRARATLSGVFDVNSIAAHYLDQMAAPGSRVVGR